MNTPWKVIFPESLFTRLYAHLFPGDSDEHGAVAVAGIVQTDKETRLLVRDIYLAEDGVDYLPGKRGYRRLTAEFITKHVIHCREENLHYLAIHNHGEGNSVQFSPDDLASHRRGYPALIDASRGKLIGALVFSSNALAGEIWISPNQQVLINESIVVGRNRRVLYPTPPNMNAVRLEMYDRQTRIFGDVGQVILGQLKVGIIGLGGVGSLVNEYLAHLGVGHLVLVDPERIEITNLPRVVGSSRWDAKAWLSRETNPSWLRKLGKRLSTPKVNIARRVARKANPNIQITKVFDTVLRNSVVGNLVDCDYLFLASDTMQSRLLFNALVHQYLIPGVQMGSKIVSDKNRGQLLDVYSVVRPVTPDSGCLVCNGLISPTRLQEEALEQGQMGHMHYVDDPDVNAPSVITLNSVVASQATNDFMFYVLGLRNGGVTQDFLRVVPLKREVWLDEPRSDANCIECGNSSASRFARGDARSLPTML